MQHIFSLKIFLAITAFAILTSCNNSPGSNQEKMQEQPDEKGTEGKTNAEVVEVKGVFHTRSSQCAKGFGLCEFRVEPDQQNATMDALVKKGEKEINTTFTLDDVGNKIKIEFMEEVPYFDSVFVVERDTALEKFMHYEMIDILKGNYSTDKGMGQFGGVFINIRKTDKM